MKKKLSSELIIIIILIPFFVWGALYYSSLTGKGLPDYTVINKSNQGYSVFYDTVKELGYPIDRSLKPIGEHSYDSVQVVVETIYWDIGSEEVKSWIREGGLLVYLSQGQTPSIAEATYIRVEDNIEIYQYGKGWIIKATPIDLLNSTIIKDYTKAYQLLQIIDKHDYSDIYFNEVYLFTSNDSMSLWEYIPLPYKIILYQFLLTIAGYFYLKGKRFGKPIPFYEEVERIENEYLHTAASLYMQGGCWDLILQSYFRSLVKLLNATPQNWIELWEAKKLPKLNKAKRIHDFMSQSQEKIKAKDYVETIIMIEELKGLTRKGREVHWKTLKKYR